MSESAFSILDISLRNSLLADSDGNNLKSNSYNYPNITQGISGLVYDRPTLESQLQSGYNTSSTKINYYLHASSVWGRSDSTSVFSCEGLTLADLSNIQITGSISSESAWITVYTEALNDTYDKSWYRSRYNFTDQYFTSSTETTMTINLTGWENLATSTTIKSSEQRGSDRVLAIAISTNSSDSDAYKFILKESKLILTNGNSKTIKFVENSSLTNLNIFESTTTLLDSISNEDAKTILRSFDIVVDYGTNLKPLALLSGVSGESVTVTSGYNFAMFIASDGTVSYQTVKEGDILTFKSDIILGTKLYKQQDLVLLGLNDEQLMTTSAQVDVINQQIVSSDATARIYVDLATFRSIFQFQTDASDIDSFKGATDIQYKTVSNVLTGDTSHNLNPMNAVVERGFTDSQAYDKDHLCVRHDFVRHIAKVVFNTEKAVDMFENETELVEDLMYLGNTTHDNIVEAISNANGKLESDTGDSNLVKKLLDQLLDLAPERFYASDDSSTINDTVEFQSVPFIPNDTIRFKYTINPKDKDVVTGLPKPTLKTYEIVLHLTNDNDKLALNPVPNDGNGGDDISEFNGHPNYYSYRIPEN